MHEYSCDSGRRDEVRLISFIISAFVAFLFTYVINLLFGGIGFIFDFFVFVLSFSPIFIWVFFTNKLSHFLLAISDIRDCSGEYKGELKTVYDKFERSHPVTVIIAHKFREMEIRVITETSESFSKTASMNQNGERVTITYTYENKGSIEDNLNMHIGTCMLVLEGNVIKGDYYTHPDRKSYGKIIVRKIE